jgi:16S rRNA G966 N2-methylase RsmD
MTLTIEKSSGARSALLHDDRIIGPTFPAMSPLDWIGWKAMALRNRIDDWAWEQRLGIRTRGTVMIHQPDAYFYGTFAYRSIFKILRHMKLRPNDVFVDLGCGKGRIVCCAALFNIRRAIGVELDGGLCGFAIQNGDRLRKRRADISIIHAPAQEFDYRNCTKIFLFNPFGEQTLKHVVNVICRSIVERPRPVEVVYVNPAYDSVFEQHPLFERVERWRWRPWGGLKFDVSFWRLG